MPVLAPPSRISWKESAPAGTIQGLSSDASRLTRPALPPKQREENTPLKESRVVASFEEVQYSDAPKK